MLALTFVIGAAPAPAVDPAILARAKEWFGRIQSGNIDRTQLDAQMDKFLTPAMVNGAVPRLKALGDPLSFSFDRSQPVGHGTTDYAFVIAFAKSKLDFHIGIDADGKLGAIFYGPHRPPEAPVAHMSEPATIAALQGQMKKNEGFSGAVLVAKDGKPIFSQAYGFADREHHLKNTLDTRFRMGSMNKMFTATAIMQLVQAGKIDLQGTVGKYLPDYPNKDIADKVTIHELLTHTGGTGDFFGDEYDKHRLELKTLDDYIKLFGARAPDSPPGGEWAYSNYGFIILGAIVERVSGTSYYDYVHDHIFVPAGMNSTGSEPESEAVANRAIGYTDDNGKTVPNTDTLPYRGTSAGGGYTTVGDLMRFAVALQGNKLLDAERTALLTTGKVPMPSRPGNPRKYAYGFGDEMINGTRCFGHDGGAPGQNGDLKICPAHGYVIVALANIDPPVADEITAFVAKRLP